MLLNGNRAVRVPLYRKAVVISAPRYVETALYVETVRVPRYRRLGIIWKPRTVRVPRYRKAVAISAPHYMETAILKYRFIGGLTVFKITSD